MELIIVTFLYALASVDVLMANSNDVNLAKTRYVQFARLKSSSRFDRINKLTTITRIGKFYLLFAPEIPRDIAFILSFLERLQRWRVS